MKDDRKVQNFCRASLVVVNRTASYVELNSDDEKLEKCAICDKRTAHDHQFQGKVKFDPKGQKYFVSFIRLNSAAAKRPSLEVIPVKKAKEPVYPMLAANEEEMITSVKAELVKFAAEKMRNKLLAVTIRERNELVLIKVDCERHLTCGGECEFCSDSPRIIDLGDLIRHFRGERHKFRIRVKRSEHEVDDDDFSPDNGDGDADNGSKCCSVCGEDFATDDLLTGHLTEVHAGRGEAAFQCAVCLRRFKNKKSFLSHKRNQHRKKGERLHECQLCGKAFYKFQHLKVHIEQTHLGSRPFSCSECSKTYTTNSALNNHKTNIHGLGEKPNCDRCGKSFSSKSQLNKHFLLAHEKDPRLTCDKCGAVYLSRDNLKAHIETCQSDEENHLCEMCDKRYKSKQTLTEHLRSTHGILPWNKLSSDGSKSMLKCKICESDFLHEEMEAHLRFSHGVMPVKKPDLTAGPAGIMTAYDFSGSSVSEAAEALLRTLTPQPDYLLRALTPLPMEAIDDFIQQ